MINDQETINIFIIRHGEAAKLWDEDPDPSLSEKGQLQSNGIVQKLINELDGKEFKVLSSPLKRARETAAPLQKKLGFEIKIDDTFAEIPSPEITLSDRKNWLKSIFDTNVADLGEVQKNWRDGIINSISRLEEHTVIFSHFMVINCVVGWLEKRSQMVSFYPDNCSITKIEIDDNTIKLVTKGEELKTIVQ